VILGTAQELITKGWNTLLQKSIGAEHEDSIRRIIGNTQGISSVPEVKTFMIGGLVIVIVKVLSHCGSITQGLATPVFTRKIKACLVGQGYPESACFIQSTREKSADRRIAYVVNAASQDRRSWFLPWRIEDATHIIIVGTTGGWERSEPYPLPQRIEDLVDFLAEKRVTRLITLGPLPYPELLTRARIRLEQAQTPDLAELGLRFQTS